jgi:hypothetical protein
MFTRIAAFPQVGAASRAIVVPDDYPSITTAIANAANGDVIYVRSGVYNESTFEINKAIKICGEDIRNTIVNLTPPLVNCTDSFFGHTYTEPTNAITINANGVKISGLTITSTGGISAKGDGTEIVSDVITIGRTCSITGSNVTVARNTLTGDDWRVTGSHLTLTENMINASRNGIESNGSYCVIYGNSILGTLVVWGSMNTITHNSYDLMFIFFGDSNTIRGNIGEISLGNSDRSCSNNVVSGNLVKGPSVWGIWVGMFCRNNVFYDNYIVDEGYSQFGGEFSGGVSVCYEYGKMGTNNTFYHNVFLNDSLNVKFYENITLGGNFWDNGIQGNYWDGYNGTDANDDSIGDTPYIINCANSDNHPLIAPFNPPDINIPPPVYDSPIMIESPVSQQSTEAPTPTANPIQSTTNDNPTLQSPIKTNSSASIVNVPEFATAAIVLLASAVFLIAVATALRLKESKT